MADECTHPLHWWGECPIHVCDTCGKIDIDCVCYESPEGGWCARCGSFLPYDQPGCFSEYCLDERWRRIEEKFD